MDDPINAFTVHARSYCSLIEDGPSPNSWIFAHVCLTQVLRVYQAALRLPEVAPVSDDLLEGVTHEAWKAVQEKVARRLARDYYWAVFEPLDQEKPDPVIGSLSDDLADIWRDIGPGVAAIDHPEATSVNDVVWHWQASFETHWGQHAASAIAALHALCFGPLADTKASIYAEERRGVNGVSPKMRAPKKAACDTSPVTKFGPKGSFLQNLRAGFEALICAGVSSAIDDKHIDRASGGSYLQPGLLLKCFKQRWCSDRG